jgi:hypothetical protein
VRGLSIPNAEVHDAVWAESGKLAIQRELDAVNELALSVHDIVDGPSVDIVTGSDPEIPVGVGAG